MELEKSQKHMFHEPRYLQGLLMQANSYLPIVGGQKVSLADTNIPKNFKTQKLNPKLTNADLQSKNKSRNFQKNNPKNELRIFHLNPRSVVDKLEYLLEFVQSNNPDLLFINETWMNSSVLYP